MEDITAEDVEWLAGDMAASVVSLVRFFAQNAGMTPRAALDELLPIIAEAFAEFSPLASRLPC